MSQVFSSSSSSSAVAKMFCRIVNSFIHLASEYEFTQILPCQTNANAISKMPFTTFRSSGAPRRRRRPPLSRRILSVHRQSNCHCRNNVLHATIHLYAVSLCSFVYFFLISAHARYAKSVYLFRLTTVAKRTANQTTTTHTHDTENVRPLCALNVSLKSNSYSPIE